jgi:5'-nucleotidase (lipoprotein e(P4) family)
MRFVRFILIIFFVVSCSSGPQIINLDQSKALVQEYYESGRFVADMVMIVNDAIDHLSNQELNESSTVVLDIDETVLSNYNHTKEIGFGFRIDIWNEWLNQGNAQVVPQMKRFYDYLISKKIKIVFLTGRYEATRESTIRNLTNQGFTQFDTLITRSLSEEKLPAAKFKEGKRIELSEKGYNIIMCVGDQMSDLEGKYVGYKVKLPNYLYKLD